MKNFSRLRLTVLLLALTATVGCDQTAKHFARIGLRPFGLVELPGGFGELRLAENPGSFLSLGASLPQTWRLVFFIVGTGVGLVVLSAYLVGNSRVSRLQFAAFALVAAGGLSNVIDRVTQNGLVTDFIFLRVGPLHTGIFNLADVAIMAGVALLFCDLWPCRVPHR
jgi:signal peptidase II